ncbi:lamin tail domain-containing protein [Candidatus Woesearchaeota archaeon]|nr:lamin tail domain-containing protein [Candidatus Woesearchaeota archaeon]
MKILSLIIALALLIITLNVVNAVRIEEVYYDPINSETGGEALVLYNEENDFVNISNWKIINHKLNVDVEIPLGTKIKPKSYFLIADEGWDNEKDNLAWFNADLQDSLTLGNIDYGIFLYDENNTLIDKIGWGNSQNIENECYFSTPALKVDQGFSLLRKSDSKDNSNDFISSEPKLYSSEFTPEINNTQNYIKINLEFQSEIIFIENISCDSSLTNDKIEIIPNPGTDKVVKFNYIITNKNGVDNIHNVSFNGKNSTLIKVINETSALYSSLILINYDKLPGFYNSEILVDGVSKELQYEIKDLVAFKLDTYDLTLNITDKNKNYFIYGDEDMSTQTKPTIKNIGNVNLDFEIKLNPSKEKNVVFEEAYFSFDNNSFTSQNSGKLTVEKTNVNLNLMPSKRNGLSFKIFISDNSTSYSNDIVLSAKRSE